MDRLTKGLAIGIVVLFGIVGLAVVSRIDQQMVSMIVGLAIGVVICIPTGIFLGVMFQKLREKTTVINVGKPREEERHDLRLPFFFPQQYLPSPQSQSQYPQVPYGQPVPPQMVYPYGTQGSPYQHQPGYAPPQRAPRTHMVIGEDAQERQI